MANWLLWQIGIWQTGSYGKSTTANRLWQIGIWRKGIWRNDVVSKPLAFSLNTAKTLASSIDSYLAKLPWITKKNSKTNQAHCNDI